MSEFELFTTMLKRAGVDYEVKGSASDIEVHVQNHNPDNKERHDGYMCFFSVWRFYTWGALIGVSHWE